MASEVHQFTVTIAPGTTKAAPQKTKLTLDNRVITKVGLNVPKGPAGLMGFYVTHSNTQILPFEQGEYFIWDDVDKEWDMEDLPTAQGWAVVGYNTGVFAHEVVIRLLTDYPALPTPPTPTVLIVSNPLPSVGVLL